MTFGGFAGGFSTSSAFGAPAAQTPAFGAARAVAILFSESATFYFPHHIAFLNALHLTALFPDRVWRPIPFWSFSSRSLWSTREYSKFRCAPIIATRKHDLAPSKPRPIVSMVLCLRSLSHKPLTPARPSTCPLSFLQPIPVACRRRASVQVRFTWRRS
jgi:hypothetical protein